MTDVDAVRALARLSRMLERACPDELSLPHYRVLAAVADGAERATRIAARLTLGKPTVSATVDTLCKRGLLERGADAEDGRAAPLHVTDAGHRLLAEADAAMAERLAEVLEHTEDPAGARAGLVRLGGGLDAWLVEHRPVSR